MLSFRAMLASWRFRLAASPPPAGDEKKRTIPADVIELVIAARIVAFEDQSPDAIKRLDRASEAFADRVKWADEPVNGEVG